MLQQDFVPVAFDQWYQRRQRDEEGRFYQKIAEQGPRSDMNRTTQGFYIASGDGELLHYNNNRGPDRIKKLMRQVLEANRDWSATQVHTENQKTDDWGPWPANTIVVQVNTKVLGGYEASDNRYARIMQQATGRDNLWIYRDEWNQMLSGHFPDSLAEKIVRFHGVDNTRGEPPMWTANEIRKLEIGLQANGTISGRIELSTDDGKRSFQADVFGKLETQAQTITRFDLVLKGDFQGAGRYTPGSPKGQFPLAVAFRLADESDVATAVRPQALKAFGRGYLHMGN